MLERLGEDRVQLDTRRKLGAFYTPPDLAAQIADWAITSAGMDILEPSVGSGVLVDAALERLNVLGGGRIFGFEIDEGTFGRLTRYRTDHRVHIKWADFFEEGAAAG